jgi:hypothetical protein
MKYLSQVSEKFPNQESMDSLNQVSMEVIN